MLVEIIHNLAMLLSLAALVHLFLRRFPLGRRLEGVLLGVLFGGIAVFSMVAAVEYRPGIVLDSRSIVLTLAGLFGGGVPAAVAMAMAGICRGLLGGGGVWAGLATIAVSGTFGIACRHWLRRRSWPPTARQLWGVGLGVHLLVLGCMLLLPAPVRREIVAGLALPFLLAYPPALVLLGVVMAGEESRSSHLKRLKHAEWLFGEAQKLTRFGSWEYRLDNDALTATPFFHELLGLADGAATLSLQDFFGRLHRDDWDAVRLAFDAAIRGEGEMDIQARLRADDGHLRWVRVVGKAVAVKGRTTQLVGNLIDITRRKTAELELRAGKERLQSILDHAPALICICGLDGRIVQASRRFDVFGVSGQDLAGHPLYELLPREGALEQWIDGLVALQAGEAVEFEEVLRHADGTDRTYLTSKFMLTGSGVGQASICYIATDITDLRRTLTERQRLAEELTAKNDELERFTYAVSHDLKAPLLTVGSYAELLSEDLAAGRVDEANSDLGHIRAAVGRMRQLIDGLLELSRIGRSVGELVPVAIGEVTAEALALLAGDIDRTGGEVVIAPDLPIVPGDPLQLRQVMQNLLQNALKFHLPGCPPRIEVDGAAEVDGGVLVRIRDNGRGIAPQELPAIFDLFTRCGGRAVGSGIGLALVRRIMTAHGGDVWAASDGIGTGSTFFLRFTAVPAVAPGGAERFGGDCRSLFSDHARRQMRYDVRSQGESHG